MSAMAWVKAHPYEVAGGVFGVGVILVLLLMPKKQAAAPVSISGYDPGYNAAVVQANGQLAAAQLTANSHAVDTNATLQAHLANNDLTAQLAQFGISKDNILSATTLGLAGASGQTAVDLANIGAGVDTQQGATAFKLASLAADTSRLGIMSGADTARLGIIQGADVSRFTTASNNDAAVTMGAIGAGRDVSIANLNDARDVSIAGLNGSTAVNLANINAVKGVQIAGIDAGVLVHQADTGLQATLSGERVQTAQINSSTQLGTQAAVFADQAQARTSNLRQEESELAARSTDAASQHAADIAAMTITKDGVLGTQRNALAFYRSSIGQAA